MDAVGKSWLPAVVLHLGDVALRAYALETIPRLPGRIYLVPRNHDKGQIREVVRGWGCTIVKPFEILYRGWLVKFTHQPVDEEGPPLPAGVINVHGHIHSKADPSPRHINVSVERLDYRPTRLGDWCLSRTTVRRRDRVEGLVRAGVVIREQQGALRI